MKNKVFIILFCVLFIGGTFSVFVFLNNRETEVAKIDIFETKVKSKIDSFKYTGLEEKTITLDKTLDITKDGIYKLSGTIADGSITISTEGNVLLVLNNVNITNSRGPAIYVKKAKNVEIKLENDSKNYLSDASYYLGYAKEVDACIFSKSDLLISGNGTLNVKGNYKNGIVSKDDLKVVSGTLEINSKDDGIQGKDSLEISGGVVNIVSKGDSLKSNNSKDKNKGFIIISGGTITLSSGQDGIDAERNVFITNGNLKINSYNKSKAPSCIKSNNDIVIFNGNLDLESNGNVIDAKWKIGIDEAKIKISSNKKGINANSIWLKNPTMDIVKCTEGIEADNYIEILGGTLNIISSDDGINVSNSKKYKDSALIIKDGYVNIVAEGDGVDSNSSIAIAGGVIRIDGPTKNDNFMIDFISEFQMIGGDFIGVSSNGLAENVSNNSKQNTVLLSLKKRYSNKFSIKDGDNEIVSYEPKKPYQAIIISNELLKKNKEYKLYINNELVETFKLDKTVTTIGTVKKK